MTQPDVVIETVFPVVRYDALETLVMLAAYCETALLYLLHPEVKHFAVVTPTMKCKTY